MNALTRAIAAACGSLLIPPLAAQTLVKDIAATPLELDSDPADGVTIGGLTFFRAADEPHGSEPWVSDGTDVGTRLVLDIRPGTSGSSPYNLVALGNLLLFAASDGTTGTELWRSDGTATGTYRVADINSGAASARIERLTVCGDHAYFAARSSSGEEPWRSDGTAAGTIQLGDLNPGAGGSAPDQFVAAGDYVFFFGTSPDEGRELYAFDTVGTTGVTRIALRPGSSSSLSTLSWQNPAALGDALLLGAQADNSGRTLWRVDASTLAATQIAAVPASTDRHQLSYMATFNGRVFFAADTASNGVELWSSDGTETGTSMLADLRAGASDSDPANLTTIGNRLYMIADTGLGDGVPWVTDGTLAGTLELASPDVNSDEPPQFTQLGSNVVFRLFASGTSHLWITDGTRAGTAPLDSTVNGEQIRCRDILGVGNGRVLFAGDGGRPGLEVYGNDGINGTELVANIAFSTTRTESAEIGQMIRFDGRTVFVAATQAHGRELWITDGTEVGTTMIQDINPGAAGSAPGSFTLFDDELWFVAEDETNGRQLWKPTAPTPAPSASAPSSAPASPRSRIRPCSTTSCSSPRTTGSSASNSGTSTVRAQTHNSCSTAPPANAGAPRTRCSSTATRCISVPTRNRTPASRTDCGRPTARRPEPWSSHRSATSAG